MAGRGWIPPSWGGGKKGKGASAAPEKVELEAHRKEIKTNTLKSTKEALPGYRFLGELAPSDLAMAVCYLEANITPGMLSGFDFDGPCVHLVHFFCPYAWIR